MAKEFSRARRIEQQILRELAQLLRFECKDQRLAWVTPVDVRLSSDLSVASIYVGILGKNADEAAEIMKVLNQAAGYFRTEIGKRMMLRITPQLRFFFDSVEEEAQKVDALLRKAAVISSEMPADVASETDKG
ncbi:MAG: 30S ribosome-binding factor RbfA [Thiotrichales bacterium]|jgi:ribosome-binding factor A|nr:30S ribosome-binding factor RbfA [Thiotrichales bacterium]